MRRRRLQTVVPRAGRLSWLLKVSLPGPFLLQGIAGGRLGDGGGSAPLARVGPVPAAPLSCNRRLLQPACLLGIDGDPGAVLWTEGYRSSVPSPRLTAWRTDEATEEGRGLRADGGGQLVGNSHLCCA